ncbi:retrotransposon ORF1 [Tanacetum coccineum]
MDPNSNVGKTCLRENIIDLSSEKTEGHGDWNSPEYQDTSNSGGKKETNAIIFHKMEIEEVTDRYVAPCFINGFEAYASEINLRKEENMISNEFAVKLCLDHEVKCRHKVVKKELIVALRGEIYFVKFIINPEEDDVKPGVVLGSSGETEKIDDDWDLLLDDLDFGDIPEIEGVEIPPFVCKMGKNSRNKRKQLEKYQMIYSDMGPSLRFAILEEERPVIETMAYSDKYKKILDEICIDKMKLDREMKKEEEDAIIKVKGEALIEKEDPGAFVILIRLEAKINLNALADTGSNINVMPYRVYKELGREELKNVNRGITMLNHSKAEPMGLLKDVLCHVGVTTIIAKFLILDMPIERDTPTLVGREFLYTCGSILNTIERITSTFDGIYHQTFRAAKTSLNSEESDSDDEEDYGIQRNSFEHRLWEHMTMRPNPHDPNAPNNMRRWRKQCFRGCGEAIDEMLTIKLSVAAFHKLYSTYEFDEVCVDDELRTKKIIKFRLYGRAFSWTLLEFARRLKLYHSDEINEEGFHVYFQGGLRSDEHFNAREYWLSISREENLSLSRSHASTIQKPILRLIAMWMRRKGASSQKESMIYCGQFITKIAKKKNLLSEKVLNSLSTPIYCRALDTTTHRESINFEGRLIPKVPEPGVPIAVLSLEQYYQQYPTQQQQQPDDDE